MCNSVNCDYIPQVPLLYQGLNQNKNEEQSTESEKPCEVEAPAEMTRGRLSIRASPSSMSFLLDTGNPVLNSTLDGVVKIAGVILHYIIVLLLFLFPITSLHNVIEIHNNVLWE
jgi:hypothetical protein